MKQDAAVEPAVKGAQAVQSERERKEAQIVQAFQGQMPRVRTSFLYKVALLLVACVMVLLPLVYVALVAAAGFGVYWHAVHNADVLADVEMDFRARLLLYFAPLIAGVILVLFMFKPLFAPRLPELPARRLNPQKEPYLFLLVGRICQHLGAPFPTAIEVDLNLNASARFHRGYLSFLGNDLVLTLGLPLVAGLSIESLTGVIAHELGHFSQGTSMRFSYIINSISRWFARVVYDRDSWDASLNHASENSGCLFGLCLLLARLGVGVSRAILWCLMMFGHGISCFLSRQAEYDADRYAIGLVGTQSFADTHWRVELLSAAEGVAGHAVDEAMEKNEVTGDYVATVMALANSMPPYVRDRIESHLREDKTGLFDTHPTHRDRILRAKRLNAPGIFKLKGPASALFCSFKELCERETREQYERIGVRFRRANVGEP